MQTSDSSSSHQEDIPTPSAQHTPGLQANSLSVSPVEQLMTSIREVDVFAWAIVGINETMAARGGGQPSGNSQPVRYGRDGHPQESTSQPTDNKVECRRQPIV
jgi:hypothetical protein